MHIEKNVCKNIYGTLLHLPSKIKDEINVKIDLEHLEIRGKLVSDGTNESNKVLPPTPYILSKKRRKKTVLRYLAKCESS